MQRPSTATCNSRKLEWTGSADPNWPTEGKKKPQKNQLGAQTHTYNDSHRERKRRLIVVHECNIDGMREKKLGEKMNQKLWVIVPAQCTQLSIVQVLRASAITAQLMPVAWLWLQLRITTLGPVQKKRRAVNWIPAVSVRRTWVRGRL